MAGDAVAETLDVTEQNCPLAVGETGARSVTLGVDATTAVRDLREADARLLV